MMLIPAAWSATPPCAVARVVLISSLVALGLALPVAFGASAAFAQEASEADGVSYAFGEGVTLRSGPHEANLTAYTVGEIVGIDGGTPPLPSRADFRFLDLIGSFSLWDDRVTGVFVYDFQNDVLPIENAKITFRLTDEDAPLGMALTIGNHKEPFSMQALNAAPQRLLNEPALPQTLAPGRDLGVSLGFFTTATTLTAGVFGENINEKDGAADGDDEWSLGARLTHAPVLNERDVLHFGVGATWERPGNRSVAFGPFPEIGQSDRPLIATGPIGAIDAVGRFGLEAAWRRGPFLAQGEWIAADVTPTGDASSTDAFFHGAYLNLSYALTGEVRPYLIEADSDRTGVFGALAPDRAVSAGGAGAWEMQGRLSFLDLDDGPIRGGRQVEVSGGVTWAPEPNIRLDANLVHARTREATSPDEHVTAATLRASVTW